MIGEMATLFFIDNNSAYWRKQTVLTSELETNTGPSMLRPLVCDACGESVVAFLMESHKLSECSARSSDAYMQPIPCDLCGEAVMLTDLAEHNESCKARFIECMYCGSSVPRLDIDVHAIQCERRPVRASECRAHGWVSRRVRWASQLASVFMRWPVTSSQSTCEWRLSWQGSRAPRQRSLGAW